MWQVIEGDCKIQIDDYWRSLEYWEEVDPKFGLISKSLINKLKLMVGQVQKVKDGVFHRAIDSDSRNSAISELTLTQIWDFLDSKTRDKSIRMKFENPEYENLVNQIYLADLVWDKFGVEEEVYIRLWDFRVVDKELEASAWNFGYGLHWERMVTH